MDSLPHRLAARLLSIPLFLFAIPATALAQEPCGLPDECKECPLDFGIDPYPRPNINQKVVGWNVPLQSTYVDDQALGPYCIPVALEVDNLDTILVKCAGGCTPVPMPGATKIDWRIPPTAAPYTFGNGSLVDAQGSRKVLLEDRGIVFYLPPEDVPIGGSRQSILTATVTQKCLGGCSVDVTFDVFTIRYSESRWGLYVGEQNPQPAPQNCPAPNCNAAPGGGCQLLGPNPLALNPPELQSSDWPGDFPTAMYVDEARPFTFFVNDIDRLRYECGIPVHPEHPCSTFDCYDFCDDLDYYWGIEPVTNYLGTGSYHLTRENSAIFIATGPGKIRLKCRVVSRFLNDETTFYQDIEILTRVDRLLDFKQQGQHRITMDGSLDDANSYWMLGAAPANTAGFEHISKACAVAEGFPQRTFPMAYTRGASPAIGLFTLRTDKLFVPPSQTIDVTPMPGMLAFGVTYTTGVSTPGTIYYAGASDWNAHFGVAPPRIEFKNPIVIGTLPNKVGKLTVAIDWRIIAFPGQLAQYSTTPVMTSHRVYTTFADPLPVDSAPANDDSLPASVYKHWETIYDITCDGASGLSTDPTVMNAIVTKFQSRTLSRKAADGWLVADATPLKYYDEWLGTFPATSSALKSMLGATPSGTCDAWAQALRASFAVQGLGGRCVKVEGFLPQRLVPLTPAGTFNGGVNVQILVKTWAPTGVAAVGNATVLGNPTPYAQYTGTDPTRGGQPFFIVSTTHWAAAPAPAGASHTETAGAPGQRTTNPPPVFNYHMIVQRNGVYYDPSYGSIGAANSWATLNAYVADAIFGVLMRTVGGGVDFDLRQPNGLPAAIAPYAGAGAPTFNPVIQGF